MTKKFFTLELAIEFSKSCRDLKIDGATKDQLARASTSIALNLAEGSGRFTNRDKRRFYRIAYGSLKECQTIFRILEMEESELFKTADRIGGSLWKLIKSVD